MRASKLQEVLFELKVGDVMATELITVHPRARMSELREILRANRISGLPVVEEGKLVGIVSIEDFIKCLADQQGQSTVGEKMTTDVRTLFADDPLTLATSKLDVSHLGRFPVVERDGGKLVGILTKGDVIHGLLKRLEQAFDEEETRRPRPGPLFHDIQGDAPTLTFRYRVKGGDFRAAGEASSRLKRTLTHLGLQPETVRRVAIACYEAEMNVVIFTEGGSMCVRVEPSSVTVEVGDSGPGIPDVEKALQPGYSTAADWVRELGFGAGMGLPNMQRMSDRFAIQSEEGKGTAVKMSFLADERGRE